MLCHCSAEQHPASHLLFLQILFFFEHGGFFFLRALAFFFSASHPVPNNQTDCLLKQNGEMSGAFQHNQIAKKRRDFIVSCRSCSLEFLSAHTAVQTAIFVAGSKLTPAELSLT